MALETLRNIEEIGGFEVTTGVSNFSAQRPVFVHHETNQLSFQIQNGPVKEHGVNGCQVDTVIATAKTIIEGLNSIFPCRENACAITKLDEALMWLEARTKNRVKRGVEGTNQS